MGIKKKLTVTIEQLAFQYYTCAIKVRCLVDMVVPSLPSQGWITEDSWFNVIAVANNDIHKFPRGMKIKLAQFHHIVLQSGLNY